MIIMYDTGSAYMPTRHYKLQKKPNNLSWKKLNRVKFDNKIHWLNFYCIEKSKSFNVYYPLNVEKNQKITILIDPHEDGTEFNNGWYHIEWIDGKEGLFEQEIKPRLREWHNHILGILE